MNPMDKMVQAGPTGGDGPMGMDMASSSEGTSLSVEKYPELAAIKPGVTISGRWTGKVSGVDNGMASIAFDSMELETENRADKALKQLTGQTAGEVGAPEGADDDEDY